MNDDRTRRVELYVRSLAPCGAKGDQDEIIERLLALRRRGIVDTVDLTVWGDAICLDGVSARVGVGSHVTDRIRAFHGWCEGRKASLEPFFTWSVVESSISGDSFERVVPPQRCLAMYVGDSLREVYPRSIDGATRTLEDGLRSLERHGSRRGERAAIFEEVG